MNPPRTRASDPGSVKIDRTIPLWGILTLAGGLVAQAVLVWDGQRLQASEIRHQSEQIHDLADQVKTMSTQITAKDAVDVGQDLSIKDLTRRVVTLEEAKGSRR